MEHGSRVSFRYFAPRDDDLDILLAKAIQDVAGNPLYPFSSVELVNNTLPRVALKLSAGAIYEDTGVAFVAATVPEAQTDEFMVTVSVSPDTGVELGMNAILTFAANATESTGLVEIAARDNAVEEANPEVTVSGVLSGAGASGLLPPKDVTLTVVDDEGLAEKATLARAWLARFGRMAAGQAVDALGERLRGGLRSPHATLAGRAVSPGGRLAAERPHWAPDRDGPAARMQRTMDAAELLRGSSFHLALGAAEGGSASVGPRGAFWGTGSAGRFDGKDGDLAVDGDTTTLVLGADVDWGRFLSGIAVSHSSGEGSYAIGGTCAGPRCVGELESYVVGAYPYLRAQVNERLSAWAMLGYGIGELTEIEGATGARVETDIAMKMGALGADGVILRAAPGGGFGLALRSDAMFVRTSWDRTAGLAAGEADVRRLRLALVASRGFAIASGGVATPSVELGLRHDGGDAETGTGVELGGAIRYANPWGLTLAARVRGLLAHEDSGYKEWGASASARLDPGASGRGLSLTFAPVWGAAPGGANGRRSLDNVGTGVAALDGSDAAARLDSELGYGFAVLQGRGVLTPYAGLSAGRAQRRTLRLGSRLKLGSHATLGLEGTRRRAAADAAREYRLALRGSLRW